MPRVHLKKKNKGGKKEYTCNKCFKKIEAGQSYYSWTFRYGGTNRRHASCGSPRASELTGSDKLSQLYAAQEAVEDTIGGLDWSDIESAQTDLSLALEDAAATATDVAQEYEYSADAKEEYFPGTGDEIRERAQDCESWAYELENAAQEIQSLFLDEEDDEEAKDKLRDDAEQLANDALYNLSL